DYYCMIWHNNAWVI
nr:immunoglobulin light chain junction region [Macaca mulatta]MOX84142.1 immunoglobulin light chain junction region [Macaca mulatta]MOY07796.1 immunoglobulin light chain junction region [Macaca mulatta]